MSKHKSLEDTKQKLISDDVLSLARLLLELRVDEVEEETFEEKIRMAAWKHADWDTLMLMERRKRRTLPTCSPSPSDLCELRFFGRMTGEKRDGSSHFKIRKTP